MDVEVIIDKPWHHIVRALKRQEGRTTAAIGYVTKRLLDLRRGDILVCDASELSVKTGRTDPKVLLAYLRRGVSVWSQPGLHAKAIARGQVAVVGSANSSNASAGGYLAELVAILRRRSAVAAIRDRIEVIARRSIALDPVTLSRLSRLFKAGREFQPMRKRAVGERTRTKARAWCIGTHYTDEHADVEKARQRGVPRAEKSAQSFVGKRWRRRYRGHRVIGQMAPSKAWECTMTASPSTSHQSGDNLFPHLHIGGERCPWCDQPIPHERFTEITTRIEAREREQLAEITRSLRDQHALDSARLQAQIERIKAQAAASESAARADERAKTLALSQTEIAEAQRARVAAETQSR
jgi:hypothetical protein